ncbi:hypothetical protein JHK82_034176 [Glycine max]|uniref:EF-hand domain-containing protein n=2 Tax=Glycine subgen. Soja TaxID=1462606 RepID=I1LTH3_SOYBN|nr:hypothetical protein JHK87_034106 [Glycine soja]KAG4980930.1 hypothetical protein JHK85_034888 [Glycine max]KAG5119756.1 hypothetical protein JHK82_034176 [Glycine max]KAG5140745.1 hypothetical protein JHK84_034513 [Glycine max]RZB76307.1 putative calcium-binding protein CML25 [Glycine soja]
MFAFLALHSCTHIKEALEYVFKKLDANGDKKKSPPQNWEELHKMISEVDSDDGGHINLTEFTELNTKKLEDSFSIFDSSSNSTISAKELCMVAASLISECSVEDNDDGTINFEEFWMMMTEKI